jgi:hypothetical protein
VSEIPTADVPPSPPESLPHLFTPRISWPEDADGLWRCEITWHSGYLRSEFRVVAKAPGARRGSTIATSAPFKYLFKDQIDVPLPEFAASAGELARELEAAGWAPAPKGGRWYSFRFVWRGDGAPPGV